MPKYSTPDDGYTIYDIIDHNVGKAYHAMGFIPKGKCLMSGAKRAKARSKRKKKRK